MINPEIIRQVTFSPGEAAALALFADVYSKNPKIIKDVLEKHEQKFTGDPNVDLLQIIQLSDERGRYFDEDYECALGEAKYFSLADLGDKLKGAVNTAGNVLGTGLTLMAPVAGMAANAFIPGSGGLATGLASSLGGALSGAGKTNTPSSSPASLPPPVQQAVQQTFSQGQTGNLDSRPSAQSLLDELKKSLNPPDDKKEVKKILGMKPMWFWISLSGLVVLIIVTILIIMHYRKKKKLAAK